MEAKISPALTIKYREVGQGSPIILLHAFPLSRAMWQPQVEAFGTEFRVIAPDLRGFGGTSPFEASPSIEQMADDVVALLEALDIHEPIALCGLSMGGYVALAFARQYSDRLRALVLADTRAEPDTAEAKAKREKMIEVAREKGSLAVVEAMLPKLVADITLERQPRVIEEITTIGAVQPVEGIIGALQALRDRPDARPGLASIKVPTLVMVGSDDTLTTPEVARTLQNGISGAWLVHIADAGHLSNLEQPDAFNKAVLTFLRSIE